MYSQLLRFQLSLLSHPWENWQFSAPHLIQLLVLAFPSPKVSCYSCLVTWKILQLPSCLLPWTDTVFSMLPPSLLPALRVAIFRPRKLACLDPADYPQPLGNLCTMLSIPEARSRHTWPAWSHYGWGRIYLLGSNVFQVLYFWCSSTSAERLGTTLTGCVASPGFFRLFKMCHASVSVRQDFSHEQEEPSVLPHFLIPGFITLLFSISHLHISHLCRYLDLIFLFLLSAFEYCCFCFWGHSLYSCYMCRCCNLSYAPRRVNVVSSFQKNRMHRAFIFWFQTFLRFSKHSVDLSREQF